MIRILASFLIPLLIGLAIINLLFSAKNYKPYIFIRLALAFGLGLGVSSVMLFLWLLTFGCFNKFFIIVEIIICLICSVALFFQKKGALKHSIVREKSSSPNIIEKILEVGFYLLFLSGLGIMILTSLCYPHGNWDAWGIWNNHARFIFRAGNHWTDSFSPLLAWSHPDYPLLLPLSIARCWFYLGTDSVWVPATLALIFSVSIILLLVFALSLIRNKSQGYLGGIVLLGTPFYLFHSTSQYADVPFAFFILSALVLFYLFYQRVIEQRGILVLGGLMTGFSAWTKNEGLLFVALFILTQLLFTISKHDRKEYLKNLFFIMMGLLPILSVIAYFKGFLSPPNDIISMFQVDKLFFNLTNFERYSLIIKTFFISIFSFGSWPITLVPFIIFYAIWTGRSTTVKTRMIPFLPLILQFIGYGVIFLLTPHDLKWHLDTSFERLLLQLWPGFLFAIFIYIRTPEEALKNNSIKLLFERSRIYVYKINKSLQLRQLSNRKYLMIASFISFSMIGTILVWSSSGVSTITWMYIYQVNDFNTFGEIFSFIKNLKIPIPIVIALGEIAEYKLLGSTILFTHILYQIALVLAFVLTLYWVSSSPWKLIATFIISVIFLWSTVIIHPGNPQIYDIYYPLFFLSYINLLKIASIHHSKTMASMVSMLSGFSLSMVELIRPFVFIIMPVLIIGAYLTLRTPRKFLWFIVPIVLFSGTWHTHLALYHNQITWTNHSGFNLSRSWTMVELPHLIKESHNAPIKPGRWANLNTAEHSENNQRIVKSIFSFILSHPILSLNNIVNRIKAILIDVETNIYSYKPSRRILPFYRLSVWIVSFWLSINVIFMVLGFFKYHFKILGVPENILIIFIFSSLFFFAIGEGGEEARFLISILPLMATFPRYISPTVLL